MPRGRPAAKPTGASRLTSSTTAAKRRRLKRKTSDAGDSSSSDEMPTLTPSPDHARPGTKRRRMKSLSPEVEIVAPDTGVSKKVASAEFELTESEEEDEVDQDPVSKPLYPVTPIQHKAVFPVASRASSSELDAPLSVSLSATRSKGLKNQNEDTGAKPSSDPLESPFEMKLRASAASHSKKDTKASISVPDAEDPVVSGRDVPSSKAVRVVSDSDNSEAFEDKAKPVKAGPANDEEVHPENTATGSENNAESGLAPAESLSAVMQARWQDPILAAKGFYNNLPPLERRFWFVPYAMHGSSSSHSTDDGEELQEWNLQRCLAFNSFQNFVNPARVSPQILTVDNGSRLRVSSVDAMAVFVIPGIVTECDLFTPSVEERHVRSITVLPFSQEFHRMVALFGYAFGTVPPNVFGATYSSGGVSFVTRNKALSKPRGGTSSASSSPAKKGRTSKFAELTSSAAERPAGSRRTLTPALYYTDTVYVFDGRKATKQFRFTDDDFRNLWTWPQYLEKNGAQKEVPPEAVVAVGFDTNVWGTDKHKVSTNIQFVIVLAD